MKIDNLNKENLRQIMAEIDKALATVKIDGVTIKAGNCSFDPAQATLKIVIKAEGGQKQHAQTVAKLIGLASTEKDGNVLLDWNNRSGKFPVIYRRPDGKEYKCSTEHAKKIFGALEQVA